MVIEETDNMAGKEKIVYTFDNSGSDEGDSNDNHCEVELELLLEKLRKKLIVVSHGGVLCERVKRNRTPDASYGRMLVYKRPHVEDFMKFCPERFHVGLWSSAREWYLDGALNCTMHGLRSNLLSAWDQNHYNDAGYTTNENKNTPIVLKELVKTWEDDSGFKGKFSPSHTLLIDGKPYKALLNPPNIGIFPNEYKMKKVGDNALGTNGDLSLYLDGPAEADDVQSYVKEHPFRQPAISAAHRDWNYYNKIITHFTRKSTVSSGSGC